MHEASLAQELLSIAERIARENGGGRVLSATVELGDLTCADPETLAFAFEVVSRGTLAEGCKLRFERAPLVVSCRWCEYEGTADPAVPGCPACRCVPVKVISGRGMRLVSIDVEEGEDA